MSGAKTVEKIRDKSQLIPGAMYCCFIEDGHVTPPGEADNGHQHDLDGQLVYFGADGLFYDADDGEECWPDYDYLVQQIGPINSEYAAVRS